MVIRYNRKIQPQPIEERNNKKTYIKKKNGKQPSITKNSLQLTQRNRRFLESLGLTVLI